MFVHLSLAVNTHCAVF